MVLTGFTQKLGKLKLLAIRKSWGRLFDESEAAQMLEDRKNGKSRHFPLMNPEQRHIPLDQLKLAIQNFAAAGVAAEICACPYPENADKEPNATGLLSLSEALKGDGRSSALRLLLEAAQSSPTACDILIDDALARNDPVQANHWQSKKTELMNPSKPPCKNSRGFPHNVDMVWHITRSRWW
jgi:hypothetical protein